MSQLPPTASLEDIVDQFTDELNRGNYPIIDEYVTRFPDLADSLRDVLTSILAIHADPNFNPSSHPDGGLQLRPGREFGEYRIVRVVGFGGMGIVYEAIHQPLQRRVALKVMSPQLSDESHRERFAIEARAAASLHHTHIVPVFETGGFLGLPYIAFQFIDGVSLEKLNAEGPLNPSRFDDTGKDGSTKIEGFPTLEKLGDTSSNAPPVRDAFDEQAILGSQIADAIAHAHEHGVLHRDIKPSNVLLDKQGDAWVTDFGLAKLDDQNFTRSGDLVGTIRYMAPERFDGRCDRRSEVYSLGMLMYELIARRSPFVDGDRAETIKQITSGKKTPIRVLVPAIPGDLETIIEKAIEPIPQDRYSSAAELAEDLRRFGSGMPIIGDKLSRTRRLIRWCKRNPAVTTLGSALAASLLLWITSMVVQYRSTVRTNILLSDQNTALEQSYEAERLAKQEAEANLTANAVTIEFLMRLFRSPDPNRDGRTVTLASQLQDALNQLRVEEEMPWENRSSLLQAVGVSLGSLGLTQESVEALELSDRIQSEVLPPDSDRLLITRAHLGSSLTLSGRLDQALNVLEPTWQSSKAVFGEFDPQTRSVANLLADALRIKGRASETIDLLEPIREWEADNIKRPSEQSTKTLNNLALALQASGRPEEAIEMMQQCLDQQTALHGPDDPRTLMACNNLANLYGQTGRIAEARPLIERVYESRREVLGADHPETLNSQNGLAGVYMSTGDLPRALTLIEDVVRRLRKTLGEMHPQTLMTSYNLGVLQLKTGDHRAAFSTFDTCVKRMTDLWNAQHPTVIKCRRYRARCQDQLGNTTEAKRDLEILIGELRSEDANEQLIKTVRDELAGFDAASPTE